MFFFHGGEEGADVEWICGRIMMVKTFSIHGDVVFGSNQSSATTSLLKEVCRARVGLLQILPTLILVRTGWQRERESA